MLSFSILRPYIHNQLTTKTFVLHHDCRDSVRSSFSLVYHLVRFSRRVWRTSRSRRLCLARPLCLHAYRQRPHAGYLRCRSDDLAILHRDWFLDVYDVNRDGFYPVDAPCVNVVPSSLLPSTAYTFFSVCAVRGKIAGYKNEQRKDQFTRSFVVRWQRTDVSEYE